MKHRKLKWDSDLGVIFFQAMYKPMGMNQIFLGNDVELLREASTRWNLGNTTFLGVGQRRESNKRGRMQSMGKENLWKPTEEFEGGRRENFTFLQDVRWNRNFKCSLNQSVDH